MKKQALSYALLTVILLSGCTQYVWVKNGQPVSGVEFDKDSLDCKGQAGRMFPYAGVSVVTQQAQVVPPSPSYVTCEAYGPETVCVRHPSSPPMYIPEQRQVVDANGASRNDYWRTCMGSKGWSMVDAKTVEKDRPTVYIERPSEKSPKTRDASPATAH